MNTCKKWGIYEIKTKGPTTGNPFTEQWIKGVFESSFEVKEIKGFYDGNGDYIVRFMPSFEGDYEVHITSSFGTDFKEQFTVEKNEDYNHGPVHVANRRHLAYADGTPYYSMGTTCYVWELQSDELIEKTFKSLERGAFNKIRFCIFPKHYAYNLREPRSYPYEGTPMDSSVLNLDNFWGYTGKTEGNDWDFYRFNPLHFKHIEKCIERLHRLGIEADLILMHPYDRWGFSSMPHDADLLYYDYVIARLSAYANVWWSLANEYDLMPAKTLEDWECFGHKLMSEDPYNHMRSIHNCIKLYDFNADWITHCCIQRNNLYISTENAAEFLDKYNKPAVYDEIAYEGDIQYGWGNIAPEEMLRRFWEAGVRGAHPGHGETYLSDDNILWWSHGGDLKGESHKRFHFLWEVLNRTPGNGLRFIPRDWDEVCGIPDDGVSDKGNSDYYLIYLSFMRPRFRMFEMNPDDRWQVTVFDTWNMTVEDRGEFSGKFNIDLPGRPYMAIEFKKIK